MENIIPLHIVLVTLRFGQFLYQVWIIEIQIGAFNSIISSRFEALLWRVKPVECVVGWSSLLNGMNRIISDSLSVLHICVLLTPNFHCIYLYIVILTFIFRWRRCIWSSPELSVTNSAQRIFLWWLPRRIYHLKWERQRSWTKGRKSRDNKMKLPLRTTTLFTGHPST